MRIGVHGKDYTPNYGGTKVKRSVKDRLTIPIFQIETTLGSYGVQATKDHIITTDTYDWGTPETAPEEEKIKINIKSKRKK